MLPQILVLLIALPTVIEDDRVITTIRYSTFRVAPTIVHGNPVRTGQVPFLVSIKEPIQKLSKKRKVWRNLCGGSIISPLKVLTAAHCFEAKHFFYEKHYDLLRVVAGSLKNELIHTGHTTTCDKGQWRSIKNVTLHKYFHFPIDDIALVVVDSAFLFTDRVDYVTPATVMTDYPRTCIAAGFGETSQGTKRRVSKELLWADIYILSRRQCDMWWEMKMDTFVCTTSKATDVGGGDSGGPLACYGTLDPSEKKGRDVLVGIVSGKNYDKTTLFTRVAAYKKWLEEPNYSPCVEKSKLVMLCLIITIFYIRLLILFIAVHVAHLNLR